MTTVNVKNLERSGVHVGYFTYQLYERAGNPTGVQVNIPWTASGGQEFPQNQFRFRFPLDLQTFDQVRWTYYMVTAGGSGNLVLKYATTKQGAMLDMVSGGLALPVDTGTPFKNSGWHDLVPGAKADDIYLAIDQTGSITGGQRELIRMCVEFRGAAR